MLEMQSEFPI